jgi:hypothetical protein
MTCIAAAGALVVTACLLPSGTGAQTVAQRVSKVRDGKVRMTFAAREDICGFGDGISTKRDRFSRNRETWKSDRSEDVVYDENCSDGPVRVVAVMHNGQVDRLRAYVGGTWRPATSEVTDIGSVSTKDAIAFLVGVAGSQTGRASSQAIFATTLADSTDLVKTLRPIAENESLPTEVRGNAVFWLGQNDEPSTTEFLRGLYGRTASTALRDKIIFSLSQQPGVNTDWLISLASNEREPIEMRKKALFWVGQTSGSLDRLTKLYSSMDSREMKNQMIFVFSQRHEPAAVDKLIDIAKNDPDRDARKKAMFWLGQSRDPKVTAFLTDIITR